jgi:hypothetical protein
MANAVEEAIANLSSDLPIARVLAALSLTTCAEEGKDISPAIEPLFTMLSSEPEEGNRQLASNATVAAMLNSASKETTVKFIASKVSSQSPEHTMNALKILETASLLGADISHALDPLESIAQDAAGENPKIPPEDALRALSAIGLALHGPSTKGRSFAILQSLSQRFPNNSTTKFPNGSTTKSIDGWQFENAALLSPIRNGKTSPSFGSTIKLLKSRYPDYSRKLAYLRDSIISLATNPTPESRKRLLESESIGIANCLDPLTGNRLPPALNAAYYIQSHMSTAMDIFVVEAALQAAKEAFSNWKAPPHLPNNAGDEFTFLQRACEARLTQLKTLPRLLVQLNHPEERMAVLALRIILYSIADMDKIHIAKEVLGAYLSRLEPEAGAPPLKNCFHPDDVRWIRGVCRDKLNMPPVDGEWKSRFKIPKEVVFRMKNPCPRIAKAKS